jgi:hypothetical protein
VGQSTVEVVKVRVSWWDREEVVKYGPSSEQSRSGQMKVPWREKAEMLNDGHPSGTEYRW